jgi:hypothetical protein
LPICSTCKRKQVPAEEVSQELDPPPGQGFPTREERIQEHEARISACEENIRELEEERKRLKKTLARQARAAASKAQRIKDEKRKQEGEG